MAVLPHDISAPTGLRSPHSPRVWRNQVGAKFADVSTECQAALDLCCAATLVRWFTGLRPIALGSRCLPLLAVETCRRNSKISLDPISPAEVRR